MNPAHCKPIRSTSAHRRGAVLAMALIAFAAAAAILFTILQSSLKDHRQIRDQQFLTQARLLAQAGIDRGLAKLIASADFRKDIWQIESKDLDEVGPAEVRIEAAPLPESPQTFRVTTTAIYPSDSEHRAQQTQATTIHLHSGEQ
jgi:hypothetical protein